MAIEFRCPQCDKLLRVSDEAAGEKAKCPSCGNIAEVPASDQADGSRSLPQLPPAGEAYATPEPKPAAAYPASAPAFKSGHVEATKADVAEIFRYAWEVWKQNLGLLIGCSAVVIAAGVIFGGVQGAAQDANPGVAAIVSTFSNLVQLFLGIGHVTIVLKLLRGQPAEFSELFGGGRLYLRMLGATILMALMVLAGVLACVIPGLVVLLLFWPYYYLIVDEKATAVESLGMAVTVGRENVLTTIVLWLASVGMCLLGCATCVGILFMAPLVSTMWGTAYLMMTGERLPQREGAA